MPPAESDQETRFQPRRPSEKRFDGGLPFRQEQGKVGELFECRSSVEPSLSMGRLLHHALQRDEFLTYRCGGPARAGELLPDKSRHRSCGYGMDGKINRLP